MFLIIPIIINVAAGALQRGAGVAIGRWAGGNIAKQYIASTVAKKAIEEARKLSLGESKSWQAAFKENPGEAFRDAASEFVKSEVRDAFGKRPEINEQLIRSYNDNLVENTGKVLHQELRTVVGEPNDLIVQIDQEKIIDRTTNDLIAEDIDWTEQKGVIGGSNSQTLDRSVIGSRGSQILNRSVIGGGDSQILNRSVIGGGTSQLLNQSIIEQQNQIEDVSRITTRDIIESTARNAFYDSFDESNLTYTVIGPDDALAGKVRSPLEAIMKKVFDVNEE